jgi:large subunit ribosomal protein L10
MPTPQKIQIVEETSKRFKESSGIYFTKYTGMNVSQATDLRRKFKDNSIEYVVTKNTLTKIAADNAGYEKGVFDKILDGQIGIAYAKEDPTAPARVLKDFVKENKAFEVVGLYFEGELFDPEKYKELANLPTKDVLLAKFASALNQPMTTLAGTLNGAMSKLAGTLDSLKNTKS